MSSSQQECDLFPKMRKQTTLLCAILLASSGSLCAQNAGGQPSVLIAYFTRAQNISLSGRVDATTRASVNLVNGNYKGNTELLAEWIQQEVGGDLFAIKTVSLYPSDYNETVDQGQNENRRKARPALATQVRNMADYDIVFLGFANWWYDMPMAVYTFLEAYDLSGKTIIPFSTSGGSGFSGSQNTIRTLEPRATVREGLTVPDYQSPQGQQTVKKWLAGLGF
jgi:flavodoxin